MENHFQLLCDRSQIPVSCGDTSRRPAEKEWWTKLKSVRSQTIRAANFSWRVDQLIHQFYDHRYKHHWGGTTLYLSSG
jgi:hypothetical protein